MLTSPLKNALQETLIKSLSSDNIPSVVLNSLLWIDASDQSTITLVVDRVDTITDKSASARVFSQSVNNKRPLYFNNDTLRFDGLDDNLINNSPFMYDENGIHIYIVGAISNDPDRRVFGEASTSSPSPAYHIVQTDKIDGESLSSFIRNDASSIRFDNGDRITSIGSVDDTKKIYRVIDTGNSIIGQFNNGTETTVNYTRSGTLTLNNISIANRNSTSESSFANCDINEIIVTGILNASDNLSVYNYLSNKWNIAFAANTVAPSISGVGYNGQTLTATAGTWTNGGTISGQWYADNVALSGETSLTYDVTETTEGANFDYRETASNGNVTATSNSIHHWIPLDINPELLFDASNTSTLTLISNEADVWSDQSSNSNNASAPTSSNRPLSGSLTLNGLNVLDFGSNDYMTINRVFVGRTVLIVAKGGTTNSGQLTGTTTDNSFSPTWNVTSTQIGYRGVSNTATRTLTSTASNEGYGAGIVTVDDPNNVVTLYALSGQSASFNQTIDSSDYAVDTIGRDYAGTPQYSEADIALIVAINSVVSTSDREKLFAYVAYKFGFTLPSGHTYESSPPDGV